MESKKDDFLLDVSCSTPRTLSMAIPAELAGAIPLMDKFQVRRFAYPDNPNTIKKRSSPSSRIN